MQQFHVKCYSKISQKHEGGLHEGGYCVFAKRKIYNGESFNEERFYNEIDENEQGIMNMGHKCTIIRSGN